VSGSIPALDDRTAIVEALAVFAAATDARDWETITGLLSPECRGYSTTGREAVVTQMQAHLGGVGPTQHLLGNHRVTVTGDTAVSLTYGRVYHVGAGEMEGSFFECLGDYTDHWVRTADGWQISYRKFEIRIALGDWKVLRPA
jgi:hypothetical protein